MCIESLLPHNLTVKIVWLGPLCRTKWFEVLSVVGIVQPVTRMETVRIVSLKGESLPKNMVTYDICFDSVNLRSVWILSVFHLCVFFLLFTASVRFRPPGPPAVPGVFLYTGCLVNRVNSNFFMRQAYIISKSLQWVAFFHWNWAI